MTPGQFRRLALSHAGAHEEPHFERTSFRVGTKIFATMSADGREVMVPVKPVELCVELLESDRSVFIEYAGWTRRNGSLGMHLAKVDADLVTELLYQAWERIAPSDARRGSRLRERSATDSPPGGRRGAPRRSGRRPPRRSR